MGKFLTIGDKAAIILKHIYNANLQVGESVEDMYIRSICAALEEIERDITHVIGEKHNFIDEEYK